MTDYDEDRWAYEAMYGVEPTVEEAFTPATWSSYHHCFSPLEPFVSVDFETTGLSSQDCEIIEIGAVRVMPGERKVGSLQRLVRPSQPLPARVARLTGLDQATLDREGVDPCEAVDELIAFIGDDRLVAYNARFDLAFLHAACVRHRIHGDADGVHSCAMALARSAWPHLRSFKLAYVAERLALPVANSHRALGDANRAANVYRAAQIEVLGLHGLIPAQGREKLVAMKVQA